ncbi:MAG: hypothetical protein ABIO92_10915 [Chloroflexia bacterium]
MRIRKDKRNTPVDVRGVSGLPSISYRLPLVVTTLSALVIFLLTGFLGVLTISIIFQFVTRSNSMVGNDPVFIGCICAPLGATFLGATVYFLGAIIKGMRDLFKPVHYTRGTVSDRTPTAGRRSGTWLYVNARYAGPDLATASHVTEDQRAASPDRSQIVQPRFAPVSSGKRGARGRQGVYLPADRLNEDLKALEPPEAGSLPPILFRVDTVAHSAMKPDDEVLIAHSPFLEHVYYVSRLKEGEWESFPNKVLI